MSAPTRERLIQPATLSTADHGAVPLHAAPGAPGMPLLPGLDDEVRRALSAVMDRRLLRPRQVLFREGDLIQGLFAIYSGSFKSTVLLRDGSLPVVGLGLAGEWLGLDGLGSGRQASTAWALEDAWVGTLPAAALVMLGKTHPAWQQALQRALGREIVRQRNHALLLARADTEGRLAAFLLDLSQRVRGREPPADTLQLRLTRAEIGSYLGLTLETVSRTLSGLQQRGLLRIERRDICLLDRQGLEGIRDCGGGVRLASPGAS